MLRLENVGKRFGDFVAVDDVTLEVPDGEFLTLLGPSGCGKTTTLRMIAGFERAGSGRIMLGDRGDMDDILRAFEKVHEHRDALNAAHAR